MREGWTYKRFGEVGSFLRGKSIQKADFVEKGLPCIHYGQIHTKFGVSVDKHLSEIPSDIYEKSIIASPGDVIIAITSEDLEGSCKSTAWLGDYDVAVSAHAAVYKHNLNPKFIVYYLRSNSFHVEKEKYARGFKVMEIKPTDIAQIPIPIPPISIQQSIVAELDKINELIGLKKSQLNDLDCLAQSIFYEMFGDPVENEKGWEVKKLGEVCAIGTGATPSRKKENLYYGGIIPWVKTTEVCYRDIYETEEKITQLAIKDTNCKLYPVGTLLMAMYGQGKTRGQVAKLKIEAATNQACAAIQVNDNIINVDYLYTLMIIEYDKIRSMAQGGNQANLNMKLVGNIPVPLPPLPLQQSFAARITAIEQQKQRIIASIKDLETLLASRMQYWFDG